MNTAKDKDGNRIKIGDCVDFKSDVEQMGEVIKISDDGGTLTVYAKNGFPGDYLRYATTTEIPADRCWKTE